MKKITQADKLYTLLRDGKPHRVDEICDYVYGYDRLPGARVAARVYDIKRKYGVEIKCWKDKNNRKLSWYQMIIEDKNEIL